MLAALPVGRPESVAGRVEAGGQGRGMALRKSAEAGVCIGRATGARPGRLRGASWAFA